MREAMIICPANGNAGGPSLWPHIAEVERKLVDAFGSCTRTKAVGRWQNVTGAVMAEDVFQIVAAYDEDDEFSDGKLEGIALQFGRDAEQQAVYIRFASGDVSIVSTRHLWDTQRLAA